MHGIQQTTNFCLCSATPALTIALSCTMLAGPLMAVVIAVSSAMGGLAALLAPPQQRGSGLHARQEFLEPEQCFSICNPTLTAVNVSKPEHPLTTNKVHAGTTP